MSSASSSTTNPSSSLTAPASIDSIYGRYKRCTEIFLQWIRSHISTGTNSGASITLRDLQSTVDSVVAAGVSCPPRCVRALNDAIRLRELFNACCPAFAESVEFKEPNARHQFFISFLKKCQTKLQLSTKDLKTGNAETSTLAYSSASFSASTVSTSSTANTSAISSSSIFSTNLYDLLFEDTQSHTKDEEEDHVETLSTPSVAASASSSSSTQAASLSATDRGIDFLSKDIREFVSFDAHDNIQRRILQDSLRCFCLLLDAGLLLHQVHGAWTDYAKGKMSLIVANGIVNEAISMMQSLHQQIQLECPYIHGLYEVHAFVYAAPTIDLVLRKSFKKGVLSYEDAVKVVSDGLMCHFNCGDQTVAIKNNLVAEWTKKWMDVAEVDETLQRLRVQYGQAISLQHNLRASWIHAATQQAHRRPFVWDDFLVGKYDIRAIAATLTTHHLSSLNNGDFTLPNDPLISNIWDEVKAPAHDVRQLTVFLVVDVLPTLFRLGDVLNDPDKPLASPSVFLELARTWSSKKRSPVVPFPFTFAIHCLLISIMCVQSRERGFLRHVMSCRSAMNKLQERVSGFLRRDASALASLKPLKERFQSWLPPFVNTKAFDEFFFDGRQQCLTALQQIYDDQKMTLTSSVLYDYCTKEQSYRALFHPLMAGYDMTGFYFGDNMYLGMACLESASAELRLILHLYHALKCTRYITDSEHIPLFELLTERFLAAKILRFTDASSAGSFFKTFLLDLGFKAELFAASKNMLEKRKKDYAAQMNRSRAEMARHMVYMNSQRFFQTEVLAKLSPAYRRIMQRDFSDVSTASDQESPFSAIARSIIQDCLPDRFYSLNFVTITDLCLRLVEVLVDAFQMREYLKQYIQGGDEECKKLLEKNTLASPQSLSKVIHLFMLLHLCDFVVDAEKMEDKAKTGKDEHKETVADDEEKEIPPKSHLLRRASLSELPTLCPLAAQTYHAVQGGVMEALGAPFAMISNASDVGAQIPGIHSCLSLCAAVLIEFMKLYKEDGYQLMRI